MGWVLRTGFGIALVLIAPGALALLALRARTSWLEALAAVPVVGLTAVFVLAEVTDVVGIPFGPPALVALLVVLAGLAVWRWRRLGAPAMAFEVPPDAAEPDAGAGARDPHGRTTRVVAIALLLVAMAVGGFTWLRGIDAGTTIPGNFDASHHGFMVARIAGEETIDPGVVLVSDLRTGSQAADYYPLALHAAAAQIHRIAGVGIAETLTAMFVFFGAVVLPLGLYALGRYLWRDDALVAGFAALLGSLLTFYPYKPSSWGGVPIVAGLALVPICVVLLARALMGPRSRSATVLAAVATAGAFSLHSSQLPMIVGLVGLLVLERWARTRDVGVLTRGFVRLVVVGVGVGVLMAPTLLSVAGGASERSDFADQVLTSVEAILGPVLTLTLAVGGRQGWLALLAVAGIAVALWQRRLYAWLAGAAVVTGLTVLAGTTEGALSRWTTFPWYRQAERVFYNLAFFVAVFGAVALALGCRWVAARFPRPATAVAVTSVVVVVALFAVAGLRATRVNRDLVAGAFSAPHQPLGADALAAFRYLARNADGTYVLNDMNADGSLWMYAEEGAEPLFGLFPGEDQEDQSFRDRKYIRNHIADAGSDDKLDRLLDEYRVRYVYFGGTPFVGSAHTMDIEGIRGSPVFDEVFAREGASVFRIRT